MHVKYLLKWNFNAGFNLLIQHPCLDGVWDIL